MNYYYIEKKDQQFTNCLYLVKLKKNIIYDDIRKTITIPNDIEYTLTDNLYKEIKDNKR